MHLYSNSLSIVATISSLVMSELFCACFSCSNNYNLSHNSLGSDDKNIVFEIPEAEIIKPGDSTNFIGVLSLLLFLPSSFTSKFISFAKLYISCLSDKLARSTLLFLLGIFFKRPFSSNSLPVSPNVNKLLHKVTGIVMCINKSLTLIELQCFLV